MTGTKYKGLPGGFQIVSAELGNLYYLNQGVGPYCPELNRDAFNNGPPVWDLMKETGGVMPNPAPVNKSEVNIERVQM